MVPLVRALCVGAARVGHTRYLLVIAKRSSRTGFVTPRLFAADGTLRIESGQCDVELVATRRQFAGVLVTVY